MKRLYEQEAVGDEAYAKELLNVQNWYNTEKKRLDDQLAVKRSNALVNYQKRASAVANAAKTNQPAQATTTQQAQTGTVTTAGQPVTAAGNPPATKVESYPDILRINPINELSYPGHDMRNWYQKPEARADYEEPKSVRRKKMTQKVQDKIWDLEGQIDDLRYEIQSTKEKFQSPSFEGAEGEVEQFFAEIGPEVSEILNSGAYKNDEEKAYALLAAGVKNPEQIIRDYYYYYPEFDPSLKEEREEAEIDIAEKEKEIESLEAELEEIRSIYESLDESTFNTENVDPYELQDLKDYLDAENISYFEEEDGSVIDFDETELDKEWKDRLENMGLKEEVPEEETEDILSIEDEEESEEDITDKDEKIDEEKVFYVEVTDDDKTFTGKIYKLFDEGDWRAKVVDGESETFEQLNYDPDWDEFDIIAFLRENYDGAELIDEEEFDEQIEESLNEGTLEDLEKIYNYYMHVNVSSLDKDKFINQVFFKGYNGKPIPINVNAKTPAYEAWRAGRNRRKSTAKGNKQNIYNYFMRVDVSSLDKDKAINKIFLKGYDGESLPINVNIQTPAYDAWRAGRDRRTSVTRKYEHKISTLNDFLNESNNL